MRGVKVDKDKISLFNWGCGEEWACAHVNKSYSSYNQKPNWSPATFKPTHKYRALPHLVLFFRSFPRIPLLSIDVSFAPFWPDWKFPLLLFRWLYITAKRVLTRVREGRWFEFKSLRLKYYIISWNKFNYLLSKHNKHISQYSHTCR